MRAGHLTRRTGRPPGLPPAPRARLSPARTRAVVGAAVVLSLLLSAGATSYHSQRVEAARAQPATAPAVEPGPDTTGIPPGTVLRPHHGDLVVRTPGATYDALDVHGFVKVKAPDVTILRSRVRGGVATTSTGLVTNYDPTATGLVIEDSELVPERPSVLVDGVKGGNFTLRRVEVRDTVDAVKVHGDDVVVEASWLHDTRSFASDPYQDGGPSHNDGVQVLGGQRIRIVGNSVSGARNAALQVTQDHSATTDLVFSGNWVDGGQCTVNLAHKPLAAMSGITVAGNVFGRSGIDDCPLLVSRRTSVTEGGNRRRDGRPVLPRTVD